MTEAERKASDYDLSPSAVKWLKGIVLLTHEIRREALLKAASEHGSNEVIEWFAQFIGLANSVVQNNREAIEIFGICEGTLHPHRAHDINLPTVFGALQGIDLARSSKARGRCHGCAFRIGSLANQSPVTTSDADWVLKDDDKFWCHEHFDENGKPTKLCPGWAEARAKAAA